MTQVAGRLQEKKVIITQYLVTKTKTGDAKQNGFQQSYP